MKFIKRSILFLVPLIIVGIMGFVVGQISTTKQNTPSQTNVNSPTTNSVKQEIDPLNCPIDMSVGEFAEFFRLGNETPISGKPILVPNPKVIKQSYPLSDRKKEILQTIAGEDGKIEDGSLGVHDSGKFDVDGDGKAESFITADIYMNHRPHIAMLVKNGNIIFEAEGAGVWIEKVYENKGFLLTEEIERFTGEYKNTRYVYKDGGFVPVWTQKVCYAQYRK